MEAWIQARVETAATDPGHADGGQAPAREAVENAQPVTVAGRRGSLACVPSRPTMFTGQYPDLHCGTQTDGLGKQHDDSRLRWLTSGGVPTLGNGFRAAGYDTHDYGKWHKRRC